MRVLFKRSAILKLLLVLFLLFVLTISFGAVFIGQESTPKESQSEILAKGQQIAENLSNTLANMQQNADRFKAMRNKLSPQQLMRLNQQLYRMNIMVTMSTTLLKAFKDATKAVVQNIKR